MVTKTILESYKLINRTTGQTIYFDKNNRSEYAGKVSDLQCHRVTKNPIECQDSRMKGNLKIKAVKKSASLGTTKHNSFIWRTANLPNCRTEFNRLLRIEKVGY